MKNDKSESKLTWDSHDIAECHDQLRLPSYLTWGTQHLANVDCSVSGTQIPKQQFIWETSKEKIDERRQQKCNSFVLKAILHKEEMD